MRPNNPAPENMAVTSVLSFEPNGANGRAVTTALIEVAPRLATACEGLYDWWHSSRHTRGGQYQELWFRFRCSEQKARLAAEKACRLLLVVQPTYGFLLKDLTVQQEGVAFGAGDPRAGHDVVKVIGGVAYLPKLWSEVQQATEWAIADLQVRSPQRSLPPTWFSWSRHLYRNLLGLE